jgi:hypothetical protein
VPMTASRFGGLRLTMSLVYVLAGVASLLSVRASSAFAASAKSTRLAITTSSRPNGQAGVAYTATLKATGGTLPYLWSLASGTLPAGLSLDVTTGIISGTPTTPVAAPLSFTVTDSSRPAQSSSINLTLTVSAFLVSVSPRLAGLTITQTLSVTPTTNDGAGVKWSASGSSQHEQRYRQRPDQHQPHRGADFPYRVCPELATAPQRLQRVCGDEVHRGV